MQSRLTQKISDGIGHVYPPCLKTQINRENESSDRRRILLGKNQQYRLKQKMNIGSEKSIENALKETQGGLVSIIASD